MSVYFVTGATGAIGSALVPQLLASPDNEVRLLMRAKSEADLAGRLDALFAFWAPGEREADMRRRTRPLLGDASMPRLGLPEDQYARLAGELTHIVHSAGNVRMNLPLEEARKSSVGSAREIVALARAAGGRLAKVEFVSTVGVGGRLPEVPEDWVDAPRSFHNTYEAAKAEAEDYVRKEVESGLPLTVHRPSMVVGDSRTGRIVHFQVFYHLCEFLSGRRTRGFMPLLGDAQIDTIPADVVAGIIVWSAGRPELTGRVLHASSGPEEALGLTALRERVRERFAASGIALPRLKEFQPRSFLRLVSLLGWFVGARQRRALGTLPVFLDYLASRQRFPSTATRACLVQAGVAIPHPGSYLDPVLDAYLSVKAGKAG